MKYTASLLNQISDMGHVDLNRIAKDNAKVLPVKVYSKEEREEFAKTYTFKPKRYDNEDNIRISRTLTGRLMDVIRKNQRLHDSQQDNFGNK